MTWNSGPNAEVCCICGGTSWTLAHLDYVAMRDNAPPPPPIAKSIEAWRHLNSCRHSRAPAACSECSGSAAEGCRCCLVLGNAAPDQSCRKGAPAGLPLIPTPLDSGMRSIQAATGAPLRERQQCSVTPPRGKTASAVGTQVIPIRPFHEAHQSHSIGGPFQPSLRRAKIVQQSDFNPPANTSPFLLEMHQSGWTRRM